MSSIFNFLFRSICPFAFILYLSSFILCPLTYAEIEITPGITLSETYFEEDRDLAVEGDNSDFITVASPSINLAHLSENSRFNLRYSTGFVWYAKQDHDTPIRHTGSLSLSQQLSQNLSLQLSDTYLRTEEPVEELETTQYTRTDRSLSEQNDGSNSLLRLIRTNGTEDLEAVQYIRTERSIYQQNQGNVSLQYRFGPENTFNLGYSNSLLINDDPALDDGVIHQPFMGYTYWFDLKNGITVNYDYREADFSTDNGSPPADDYQGLGGGITFTHRFKPETTGSIGYNYTVRYFDGLTEDYQVHNAFLGLTHSFSPDLNVSLQGGYFVQDRERSSNDFSGLTYSASLNRSFAWGSFQVSGLGGWSESYLDPEQRGFTRFWSFQSGLTYQMAENVYSQAGASYRQDESASSQSWRTVSGTAGIVWRFYKYFSCSLTYSYINGDSDVTTSDYSRNQIMFSLSANRLFKL